MTTERGQTEGNTLQGIQGEGTNSMEDDEDEDEVLEEDNGLGQEQEEEEEKQHPFQEDHVDVTDFCISSTGE